MQIICGTATTILYLNPVHFLYIFPQSPIDEDQIRDYLKSKLAYFKVPKYISVVKEYPMTVTGKLQKFKMREYMIETLKKQALQTEA